MSKRYCVSIRDIPDAILDAKIIRDHFENYGKINKLVLDERNAFCEIYFNNREQVKRAQKGNICHGYKLNITTCTTPPTSPDRQIEVYDDVDMDTLYYSENESFGVDDMGRYDIFEKSIDDTKKYESEKFDTFDDTKKYESEKFDTFDDMKKYEIEIFDTFDDMKKYETSDKSTESFKNNTEEGYEKTSQKNNINFQTTVAITIEDKLTVLEERDKQLREYTSGERKINDSSKGTCPDMCPEKERLFRDLHRVCSIFECETIEDKVQVIPERLVKEYSRSSADQEFPLPHELRPEPVLTMTMRYLVAEIIPKIETTAIKLGEWYHFCWDRLRSIRKDIVQQQLCDLNTVSIIEQCARFHICCYDLLFEQRPPIFDDKLNTENLVSCLQILTQMYDDLSMENINCENEAEFRSYMILLQLNQCDFIWLYNDLSDEIRNSIYMKQAMEIYNAYSNNYYYQFFKLVEKTPYLPSCILQRFFTPLRIQTLKMIINGHCFGNVSKTFTVEFFQKYLNFDNLYDTSNFLEKCGLEFNSENENEVKASRQLFMIPENMFKTVTSADMVKSKRIPISNVVVASDEVPSCPQLKVHSSFDENHLLKADAIVIPEIRVKESSKPPMNYERSKFEYEEDDYYFDDEDRMGDLEDGELIDNYSDGEHEYMEDSKYWENDKYSGKYEYWDKYEEYFKDETNDEYIEEISVYSEGNENPEDLDDYIEEVYEFNESQDRFNEYSNVFNKLSKKSDSEINEKMDDDETGLWTSNSNFGVDVTDASIQEKVLGIENIKNDELKIGKNSNWTFLGKFPSEKFDFGVKPVDKIVDFRVKPVDKNKIDGFRTEKSGKNDFPMELTYGKKIEDFTKVDTFKNPKEMIDYRDEEEEKNKIEIERKKNQHEMLKKLIKKNIRKKYALKYGKIWKLKTKNILKERDNKRLKKLSIAQHLEMWGTVRNPSYLSTDITKRIKGWNKICMKAENLLNCEVLTPCYKGKQIAELLTQNLKKKIENCISWKLLISLPENSIESFVIKTEEILKILFYANPETNFGEAQVIITSCGIKVLTSMVVEKGQMARNGVYRSENGITGFGSGENKDRSKYAGERSEKIGVPGYLRTSRSMLGEKGDMPGFGIGRSGSGYETNAVTLKYAGEKSGIPGYMGTNAVIFFVNNGWETTEDCINRLNRIILNNRNNKLINIRLIIIKLINQDDDDEYVQIILKKLEEYKKSKLISSFTSQMWNNFLSIFHATAYLAKNSNCTYIPEICNLSFFIVKVTENFLSTLIRHNDALHRVINSINDLIDLYNKFLSKLHEILFEKNFEISNEFLRLLIANGGNEDGIFYVNTKYDDVISNLMSDFQLPKFKKWPPSSDKHLTKLLKKYCKFIDQTDMLYPTILRLLTSVKSDNIEEILKFTPWIAVLELWSKYNVKNIEINNKALSHAYVIFKHDRIKLITDHLWWLQDNLN